MLSILGKLNTMEPVTELQFSDGRVLRLPTALLNVEQASTPVESVSQSHAADLVVPLIEEQLEITKRTVATGKIRLETRVEAYDVTVDEPLAVSSWKVERVAVGQVVETAPSVRQEGAMTIYPIVEERLVLTKELVLVEEIRVSCDTTERRDTQTVVLRREHSDVTRDGVPIQS